MATIVTVDGLTFIEDSSNPGNPDTSLLGAGGDLIQNNFITIGEHLVSNSEHISSGSGVVVSSSGNQIVYNKFLHFEKPSHNILTLGSSVGRVYQRYDLSPGPSGNYGTFNIVHSATDYDGSGGNADNVFGIGYNFSATNSVEKTGEHAWGISFENEFVQAGFGRICEYQLRYFNVSGEHKRPIFISTRLSDDYTTHLYQADTFRLASASGIPGASQNKFDAVTDWLTATPNTLTYIGDMVINKGLVVNENSNDADFRVESNDNTTMLLVDAGLNRVGIGTVTLNETFNIGGSFSCTSYASITGQVIVAVGSAATPTFRQTGTTLGIAMASTQIQFVQGSQVKALVDQSANFVVGSGSLTTGATNGFLYIPSSAGAPTGTPTSFTGRVTLHYDSTNNALYIYNGAWRSVTLS